MAQLRPMSAGVCANVACMTSFLSMCYRQDVLSQRRGTTDQRISNFELRVQELEKLLAEEKAKASQAEVAHLQAVVKWCATSHLIMY